MGFWIYMAAIELLIPLTMIIFSRIFARRAPRDINFIFGYRTEMSMKNRDTWEFAHRHCAKIWLRAGLILLPVSVAPMLFTLGRSENVVGTAGAAVCLAQVAVLILSIIPTEKALRRTFDEFGRRRNSQSLPDRED